MKNEEVFDVKRVISLILLAGILISAGVAFAASDTIGPCKLCGCNAYKQGVGKTKFVCECAHSTGVHESRPI